MRKRWKRKTYMKVADYNGIHTLKKWRSDSKCCKRKRKILFSWTLSCLPEAAVVKVQCRALHLFDLNIKCCSGVSGMIATFRRIWGPSCHSQWFTLKCVNAPVVYRCFLLNHIWGSNSRPLAILDFSFCLTLLDLAFNAICVSNVKRIKVTMQIFTTFYLFSHVLHWVRGSCIKEGTGWKVSFYKHGLKSKVNIISKSVRYNVLCSHVCFLLICINPKEQGEHGIIQFVQYIVLYASKCLIPSILVVSIKYYCLILQIMNKCTNINK